MGILSGLFRSKDNPADRTAGSSYGSKFFANGAAPSGVLELRKYGNTPVLTVERKHVFLCRPSFLFQKSNLDGIINTTYSCHVAFAMICTERERL